MPQTVNIDITDIGPVEEFSERLHPGVTVLRGPQGCGKTTILRTVELGVTGDTTGKLTKLTKRDGSKLGTADIAGRLLKINRVTRSEGELTVDTLGDIDLATIHSPKFEKPETRDATRIKALVRMAAVTTDLAAFKKELTQKSAITAEEFDALTADMQLSTDIVEDAAIIKRAVDRAALAKEKDYEKLAAQAKAKLDQINGMDLSKIPDIPALLKEWQDATANESTITAKAAAAKQAEELAEASRKKLAALQAANATSTESATAHQAHCLDEQRQASLELNRIKLLLTAAEEAVRTADDKCRFAAESLTLANQHAASLASLTADINAVTPGPTPAEIEAAMSARSNAHANYLLGEKVKSALAIESEARELNLKAKELAKSADRHRIAAGLAFNCVTDALSKLNNCPLSIKEIDGSPRLVIDTDRSVTEPFDELSDGERWKVLVPLATAPNRIITLSQAGYGELQPATRLMLHNLTIERGGYLLTAQADDKPLRAEPYKEGQ